jgi:UDP-3-O-[3-hydroxymyristoyl] glucosamine N-acyltransferase
MEFSANQIAALVNGVVEGNGDATVNTFAKIEEGHVGALSFLANPKYSHYLYTSKSSVILVSKSFELEHPVAATLIRVDDPYSTVAQLMTMVSELTASRCSGIESPSYVADGVDVPTNAYIGAFTYVATGAKIGNGVQIYPQCYIGANVEVGENTIIYPGVKIYHGCKIGSGCILHSGVVIGADGFGFAPMADGSYSKIPQMGNVVLEDNVEVGANTTVDRATMGSTRVRKGTKLDNLIQVAHNVEIGEHTVMAAQVGVAGSTKVGSHCMIGGQVGFAGHIHVGDRVEVGAQSGIPSDVKDGSILMGYPAVDAKDFKRQVVYIKQLGTLARRIAELEKQLKK